jgi:putative nucleotidyltransferase with HDIG domain
MNPPFFTGHNKIEEAVMNYTQLMDTLRGGDVEELCQHELAALRGCQQNPVHHPEGDAWAHSVLVVGNARAVIETIPEADRDVFLLVALLHDVGKPPVTAITEGKGITAYKHGKAGVELARAYLERVGAPTNVIERVLPMIDVHMQIHTMDAQASIKSWRKLDKRFPLALLAAFGKCDSCAGKGSMDEPHAGAELALSKLAELQAA